MAVIGLVAVAWVWGGSCVCAEVGGVIGVFTGASAIGLVIGGVCVVLVVFAGFAAALSSAWV